MILLNPESNASNPITLSASIDYLIIDATAFIAGFNFNLITNRDPDVKIGTVSGIIDEVKKNPLMQDMIEIALEQKILQLLYPSDSNMDYINQISKQTGDLKALSENDKTLLAVCLDLISQSPPLNVCLMTDDYSIQNSAKKLHIPITPFRRQGIKKKIKWEIYCPNCYHTYSADQLGLECEMCSAKLKRRPYKGKKPHL
jgi:UPF0271 protein